jgi:hypothetical protein
MPINDKIKLRNNIGTIIKLTNGIATIFANIETAENPLK